MHPAGNYTSPEHLLSKVHLFLSLRLFLPHTPSLIILLTTSLPPLYPAPPPPSSSSSTSPLLHRFGRPEWRESVPLARDADTGAAHSLVLPVVSGPHHPASSLFFLTSGLLFFRFFFPIFLLFPI